jgi:hypothetical protein
MKLARIISLTALVIYGVLALDKFNVIVIYEGILGFSKTLAPIYTIYYVVMEVLIFLMIFFFKFVRHVFTVEQLQSMDVKDLEKAINKKSLLSRVISISIAILSIAVLNYTLPVVIVIGYVLSHFFKLEAIKMVDKKKDVKETK